MTRAEVSAHGLSEIDWEERRREMIRTQLAARGILDRKVLAAMGKIPRHRFLPPELAHRAYEDAPVPIGHGQTLSQPYIVAFMTEQLELKGDESVLEIGTGSGYQTAVLAEMARRVCTLEVLETLSHQARALLQELGYRNVSYAVGDGRLGWPEESPFDAILAAAAAEGVPEALQSQLGEGGRLILPLGNDHQDLWIFRKAAGTWNSRCLLPVRFVPLVHGSGLSG